MAKLKLQSDVKPFTMIKNAIIDSEGILNEHEKLLYIVLLRYGNKAFPSLTTLAKKCGFSKRTVQRTIHTLIEKGFLKKKHRVHKNKGTTSNVYLLFDNDNLWNSTEETLQETETIEAIGNLAKTNVTGKEKIFEEEPIKAHPQVSYPERFPNLTNPISKSEKSQELERYTLEQIHQLFDYDFMLLDYPEEQQNIDDVMNILYTAMNTTKQTIRITGEDKPTMVVIGKLMKLDKDSILYAIKKFSKQTERIQHPLSYMLTMLYHAPEQCHLDIQNLAIHNMVHWKEEHLKKE